MPNPQPEAVARHYDSPESQLASIIFNGHMHLGYWDEAGEGGTYAEASARLTRVMIDKVRIERGQRFCDLGCGVGVPAIELAASKGCHVEGLTVSRFQQQDATARAQEAGMGDRARFTVGNVLDMPFAPESFDGGWFFESIFHIGHPEALASARHVLKPGATLVIADLTLLPSATAEFVDYARRNMHSSFIAQPQYAELLNASGFELLDITDVSEHVMPQLVPKITETIALHRQKILDLVGKDVIDGTIDSFRAMSDNLQYVLVSARRQ
jgi:cyclopropane fatty-acyl-phospholipid synthase-like methyltransferase